MADETGAPEPPQEPEKPEKSAKPKKPEMPKIPPARIGIWIIVGGLGLYLVITGLIGALTGNPPA